MHRHFDMTRSIHQNRNRQTNIFAALAFVFSSWLQGLPEVYRIENGIGLPSETIAFFVKGLVHICAHQKWSAP